MDLLAETFLTMKQLSLSLEETQRLNICEAVIQDGLETFVKVGNALLEIRDLKLYRKDFGTFEDYCRQRWKMVRRQADRLIQAAEVVVNLRPIGLIATPEKEDYLIRKNATQGEACPKCGQGILDHFAQCPVCDWNHGSDDDYQDEDEDEGEESSMPTHESQVRPLTKLEPEQQREAWELAKRINPNPTAIDTERAAEIVKQALAAAHQDAQQQNEARTPVEGKPNPPPINKQWIELTGAVARILRIDDFNVKAIGQQEMLIHQRFPELMEDQIGDCKEAVKRIQSFVSEVVKLCPKVTCDR